MLNPRIKNYTPIYFLLIALILIWSLSWPIAKIGLEFTPPLWFAAYRLLVGTFAILMVVASLGKLHWPKREDIKIILTIGLLQVGLFMLLINLGLFYVPAGHAAILVYTTPIWVVPISILFFNEKPGLIKWLGCLLGVIGVLILFNPLDIDWHNHQLMTGYAILLLAALSWAISILCARYMSWPHTPLELIFWQLLVGVIPVLMMAIIKEPHAHIIWNHTFIWSLLYLGIFATGFAYWGTVVVSKNLSPITTSLGLLAVPVFGLLFSAIMLHEPITLSLILSMLFIVGGLVCVIVGNHKSHI